MQLGEGGAALSRVGRSTFDYDIPNLGANASNTHTVAVPGVRVGANVLVNARGELGDLMIQWVRVTQDGQIQVRFFNTDNVATNRPNMTFDVTFIQ